MWKRLERKEQCSSPAVRHGYSMTSYQSGHKFVTTGQPRPNKYLSENSKMF